jgi:hypothetical protein
MIGYATLSFLTIITLQWLYELVRLWHIPSSLSLPLVSLLESSYDQPVLSSLCLLYDI